MAPSAVIFGCEGTTLSDTERAFFKQADPWGFILFLRNLEDKAQIQKLCADLRASVGRDAPILIDQEGGRVARLRPPLAKDWPYPRDQVNGLSNEDAAAVMYDRYKSIALELIDFGIDVNCAPMLDVCQPDTHNIISDRVYGDDPQRIAAIGQAVSEGLLDGGVLPIMKHIPGHGRALIDSHLDMPRVDASSAALSEIDFAPFRALNDLPMAMTAHVQFDAIDPDYCATLSRKVITAIRDEIGFDGLLMTDDMSMKALTGSFKDRTEAAITAGCDMALHCNGVMVEMEQVLSGLGRLQGDALRRAEAALAAKRTV